MIKTSPLMAASRRGYIDKSKINHVTLVLDTSASMNGREREVISATDNVVQFLARRSRELNQETRITVYLFDTTVDCVIYDKDVLRMPSISDVYTAHGPSTNLIGATLKAITESEEIPQKYGDHAFLFYIFTDGNENANLVKPDRLLSKIRQLSENYTLATLVPDARGRQQAERFGFPRENIHVWDTTLGVEEVGREIVRSTEAFYQARESGVRGTKNLFTLDSSKLSDKEIKAKLQPLPADAYRKYWVKKKSSIAEFVSYYEGKYVKGMTFYELMKPETVQPTKAIAIATNSGEIYVGSAARKMLGLPNYEVKVNPETGGMYKIFVQSTSVNRWLIPGTEVLVMRGVWLD